MQGKVSSPAFKNERPSDFVKADHVTMQLSSTPHINNCGSIPMESMVSMDSSEHPTQQYYADSL